MSREKLIKDFNTNLILLKDKEKNDKEYQDTKECVFQIFFNMNCRMNIDAIVRLASEEAIKRNKKIRKEKIVEFIKLNSTEGSSLILSKDKKSGGMVQKRK